MEVTAAGASAPGGVVPAIAGAPLEPAARRRFEPARRFEPVRVVPSFSSPTATYGPRGEFPRPLLISLSYPVPSQTPFAGILPREPTAARDKSPDPPAAYRGRLAAAFLRTSAAPTVDTVR